MTKTELDWAAQLDLLISELEQELEEEDNPNVWPRGDTFAFRIILAKLRKIRKSMPE